MLLKFSIIQDGKRVPLTENGVEVTLTVDAPSKSAAYTLPEVVKFCADKGNDCRVREVI